MKILILLFLLPLQAKASLVEVLKLMQKTKTPQAFFLEAKKNLSPDSVKFLSEKMNPQIKGSFDRVDLTRMTVTMTIERETFVIRFIQGRVSNEFNLEISGTELTIADNMDARAVFKMVRDALPNQSTSMFDLIVPTANASALMGSIHDTAAVTMVTATEYHFQKEGSARRPQQRAAPAAVHPANAGRSAQ